MEYQSYQQRDGSALGWDDEIQQDSSFVLLPEGDYPFRILKVDKGHYNGGEKISACPKAIVEFEITAQDGTQTTITENFLLHSRMEWKLSEFFASVGMKQKGEKLRMNWSPALIGKTGVAKISVNSYTKDGQERQNNKIAKLYPAYDLPAGFQGSAYPRQGQPAQGGYTPPQNGWRR